MPRETNPAFVRTHKEFHLGLVGVGDAAGAVSFLVDYVMPYKAALERVTFTPSTAGAGAGASQVFKVRKGGATGTVIATITLTLANTAIGGAGVVATVAAADDRTATFKDGDTLSITKDAGGTAFTTFDGILSLTFRQRPQARS